MTDWEREPGASIPGSQNGPWAAATPLVRRLASRSAQGLGHGSPTERRRGGRRAGQRGGRAEGQFTPLKRLSAERSGPARARHADFSRLDPAAQRAVLVTRIGCPPQIKALRNVYEQHEQGASILAAELAGDDVA